MESERSSLLRLLLTLANKTNLLIIEALSDGRLLKVAEVERRIERLGSKLTYRESVYKALEKLTDVDLLEKTYVKNKGICYKLSKRQLFIDFVSGTYSLKNFTPGEIQPA
jgi:Fe2+ or Zn2+ uptake regulation protein